MIRALLLLLAFAPGRAAPGADPCAPVEPAPPDPAAAAVYRAVAESEEARGSPATAAVAYRAAAERDPGDEASRAALARLCVDAGPADPFAVGVARLEAGDPRGALRAFRTARGGADPTPALALLEALCHLDLGEDARAEPLLRVAERSPAQRDAARLYLGLARLRAGDAAGAAPLFDAASGGPRLARVAADLARLARREGRLVVSLLAESGWDSNVTLAPAGADPGPESDGAVGLTAAALWRPLGAGGPYLRAAAGATRQLTLGVYDFAAADGAAGWQLRSRSLSIGGQYDVALRRLGGDPYLAAHRLLASAVWGRRRTLSVAYSARLEEYAGVYDAYSGVVHRAELRGAVPLGRRARAGLSYVATRDLADAADLSFLEHGPRADLRVALGGRARIGLEAGAALRRYDEADAAAGVVRDDVVLDATALGEVDLGAHLTARLALHARRNASNVDALDHEKLVPSLGLLWTKGFP